MHRADTHWRVAVIAWYLTLIAKRMGMSGAQTSDKSGGMKVVFVGNPIFGGKKNTGLSNFFSTSQLLFECWGRLLLWNRKEVTFSCHKNTRNKIIETLSLWWNVRISRSWSPARAFVEDRPYSFLFFHIQNVQLGISDIFVWFKMNPLQCNIDILTSIIRGKGKIRVAEIKLSTIGFHQHPSSSHRVSYYFSHLFFLFLLPPRPPTPTSYPILVLFSLEL